nr:hypothetical protein [Cryobacterium lyxosi]
MCLDVPVGGEKVVDCLVDECGHVVDCLGVEPFGGHGLHDVCFDLLDSDRWCRAESALFGRADEVLVHAAVSGVLAVQQATAPTSLKAFTAVQDTF